MPQLVPRGANILSQKQNRNSHVLKVMSFGHLTEIDPLIANYKH